ncbi:MAG: hypothetical protein OK455_07965 [Thaumarchaeota archaeon]|nr:hypothetical protein [Nitrososphaerota archaeon]
MSLQSKRRILLIIALALLVPMLPPSAVTAAVPPTTPPSVPVALSVISTPPKLPADGGDYSSVVISMQDATKLPSIALTDTLVFLTSSQSNVGSLPPSALIPAGQAYATVNFTTTTTPGMTTITASSSGLSSASAQISTFTPSGFPQGRATRARSPWS